MFRPPYCGALWMPGMLHIVATFKTIQQVGFSATLSLLKFKVALNPTYRPFKTLPKIAPYYAYQMLII